MGTSFRETDAGTRASRTLALVASRSERQIVLSVVSRRRARPIERSNKELSYQRSARVASENGHSVAHKRPLIRPIVKRVVP